MIPKELDTVQEMHTATWYLRHYKKIKHSSVEISDSQVIKSEVVGGSFEKEEVVDFLQWFQGGIRIGLEGNGIMYFSEEEQVLFKEDGEYLYVLKAVMQ